MSLIDIKNLRVMYGMNYDLDDVTLSLDKGRIIGLLGPNGSGKTTLIKAIAGVLQNYEGEIRIDGKSPCPETKGMISYLPDKSFIYPHFTSEDMMKRYGEWFRDFDPAKTKEMLALFKIGDQLRISAMSKGMQEKVQIALAMGRNAIIYLLDEPLSGVDPASRSMILESILRNYCEDSLMLLSTHQVIESEAIMDEAIFLREGKVVLHDASDLLRERRGKSLDQIFREVY